MEIPCVSKHISRWSQIDRMVLWIQGYGTKPSPLGVGQKQKYRMHGAVAKVQKYKYTNTLHGASNIQEYGNKHFPCSNRFENFENQNFEIHLSRCNQCDYLFPGFSWQNV